MDKDRAESIYLLIQPTAPDSPDRCENAKIRKCMMMKRSEREKEEMRKCREIDIRALAKRAEPQFANLKLNKLTINQ